MSIAAPDIASGAFYASFVFDVADTIDLNRIGEIAGKTVQPAPLRQGAKPSPEHIQFAVPPLAVALPPIKLDGRSAKTTAKIYDYGVVSVRFVFPYAGPWEQFAEMCARLRMGSQLEEAARSLMQSILEDSRQALDDPHEPLVEDYFASAIEQFAGRVDAAELMGRLRPSVVRLLMGENQPLSPQEQFEAIRLHFSYATEDLIMVLWDAAFIYDTRSNAEVLLDLLEFANTQLVEFRTYDARLDSELDVIYAFELSPLSRFNVLRRRDAEQRAERLRYLLVDISELTDRASNALKIIGDAYYARVYRAVASRLGLDIWRRQIETKLDSVRDIYGYLVDQAQTARNEFLELIIIILILIEIVVGIVGLRH